jgi:hypothetical protein
VSQEPTLYAGTIRFNIMLGAIKPPSEVTQEELEKACRDANILDFIKSLPEYVFLLQDTSLMLNCFIVILRLRSAAKDHSFQAVKNVCAVTISNLLAKRVQNALLLRVLLSGTQRFSSWTRCVPFDLLSLDLMTFFRPHQLSTLPRRKSSKKH